MIKFEFKLNGKKFDPNDFENLILQAALESIEAQLRERIGTIRDPDTGEFPTVVVSGDSLENLQVVVEGSDKLRALVSARLGLDNSEASDADALPQPALPRVFLSYANEDRALAETIARTLMAAGIETWWDGWSIAAGDSIRRKVEEGIEGCTHFLVLLTPVALSKPWVNEEIDAGFMRKVSKQARFIALRHDLDAEQLPALLRGSASPALGESPDLTQLISDIHGISRKPALGAAPEAVRDRTRADPGYSAAANAVARQFVERTQYARKFDPCLTHEELMEFAGLSEDDVTDALHELSQFVRVDRYRPVVPLPELFVKFDPLWKDWDPSADALTLATAMMDDPAYPTDPAKIDARLEWGARRLNPAIAYLEARKLASVRHSLDGGPYLGFHVSRTDETRRFVKSRTE